MFQVRLASSKESDNCFKSTDRKDEDLNNLDEAFDSQSSSKIADMSSSGFR